MKPWVPSIDYLLIAKHMPENMRESYIARSEAWFKEHPPRVYTAPDPPPPIDPEALVKLLSRYGTAIPLDEYRAIGYSEKSIEKIKARRQWCIDHEAELAAEIERRWPGPSGTKKKKVIKAVKKIAT